MQFRNGKMYIPTDKGSLSVNGVGYLEIENNNPETIKKKGILKAANQSPKKGTALKPECP